MKPIPRPGVAAGRRRGSGPNPEPMLRGALRALRAGGLAIIPTDTVYGIAADPASAAAGRRLRLAKKGDARKPVALLAAGVADVERFGGVLGPVERRLAAAFWPGGLTLVLRVRGGKRRAEGFRVPDHAVCRRLLRLAGGVLRVSSANLSGRPPALTAAEAVLALGGAADAVVDAGPSPGGVARGAAARRVRRAGRARENGDFEEVIRWRRGGWRFSSARATCAAAPWPSGC